MAATLHAVQREVEIGEVRAQFGGQLLAVFGQLRLKALAQLLVCRKLAEPLVNVG
jgi:hypothetical protein